MEAATSRFLFRRALTPAAPRPTALDPSLAERARDGDSGAFEALYARYYPEILWYCRRKLRSREDAEDAAQTTFATAYRELLRAEDPVELRSWLYGIARHRCLTVLRARRADVDPLDHELSAGEDAADAVVRRQDLRELFLDLGALPERQRSALVLSEVGGLSHAQIASTLGCRASQVKALVFQARSNLADSRTARGVTCAEIRREIASARGAALLRRHLRRHVSVCPGCKQFEAAVKRERSAVAFGLSLFPGLGSGLPAALGGAARLRLAQPLANLPFGASLPGGGLRWAAALAAAGATVGGGVAAIEVGEHPAGGSSPVAAALAPPALGGLDPVPRLTAAPSWAGSPRSVGARRSGGGSSGVRTQLVGVPGAVARRYARRAGSPRGGYGIQTLASPPGQQAGPTAGSTAAPSPPVGGSTLSSRSEAPAAGSVESMTRPDHRTTRRGGGSDHPGGRGGSPGNGPAAGPPARGPGDAPSHSDPGQGTGGPPQGPAGSRPGPGASHGAGGGSQGAGNGDGHGPPPGRGKH
jgi:RNA polymerase sigma factor (sigma-70 family)